MIRRKRLPLLAGWMLAVMLFSQAALAAFPCVERLPARAVAAAGAMKCCAVGGATIGALDNANVCMVHCTADAQKVDAHQQMATDAPLQPVLVVQAPRLRVSALSRAATLNEVPPAAPPLILFKQFRN